MASKHQMMQELIRRYKIETGIKEVDMHEVARWAVKKGWAPPKPVDPFDRLAREFSKAAREELRTDQETGRPYRANHAVRMLQNGQVVMFWVDIDEAPRKPMQASIALRREQMVGDALQLSLDADHWNSIHPNEEPIVPVLDLTEDVEEKKFMMDDDDDEGAA